VTGGPIRGLRRSWRRSCWHAAVAANKGRVVDAARIVGTADDRVTAENPNFNGTIGRCPSGARAWQMLPAFHRVSGLNDGAIGLSVASVVRLLISDPCRTNPKSRRSSHEGRRFLLLRQAIDASRDAPPKMGGCQRR
jgi:hypothetical protein